MSNIIFMVECSPSLRWLCSKACHFICLGRDCLINIDDFSSIQEQTGWSKHYDEAIHLPFSGDAALCCWDEQRPPWLRLWMAKKKKGWEINFVISPKKTSHAEKFNWILTCLQWGEDTGFTEQDKPLHGRHCDVIVVITFLTGQTLGSLEMWVDSTETSVI